VALSAADSVSTMLQIRESLMLTGGARASMGTARLPRVVVLGRVTRRGGRFLALGT
jgi:hypothetical protein